jgi:PAS domain S-box-containing protein
MPNPAPIFPGAPLPADEAQRLEALRALALLDTPPEERFDRITRLAQRLFDVPVAQLTLVDESRQWFKSSCGLPLGESPRAVSFCAHAILEAHPLVVPDTHLDERFRSNPLVLGAPNIRFYAGQPLRGPLGQRVGTLCVIDRRPRHFTADDLQNLADLALWAEEQLTQRELGRAVEELRLNEQRLSMLMASMPDGVLTLDPQGTVQSVNPAAERILGWRSWELVGTDSRRLFAEPCRDALPPLREERSVLRPDGSLFAVDVAISITPGNENLYVMTLRDNTLRKGLQALQKDMTQMLIHDLRSPLTGILGFAELVHQTEHLPPDLRQDVTVIVQQAERMRGMVGDLLDISRMEEGKMPLRLSLFELGHLAQEVLASVPAEVELKSLRECSVRADRDLIWRVLENLVFNAVKYASGSPACVVVRQDAGWVRVEVQDIGPGIAPELVPHIFEKFRRGPEGERHSTGLGLTFCKLAVEAHGGRIGVVSQLGKGTTFWFCLPLHNP